MSKLTSDADVQVHVVASARVAAPGPCRQPPVKKSPAVIVLLAQTQLPSNTSGMEVACADGAPIKLQNAANPTTWLSLWATSLTRSKVGSK